MKYISYTVFHMVETVVVYPENMTPEAIREDLKTKGWDVRGLPTRSTDAELKEAHNE
jgi:hypothetical protein